MAFHRRWNNRPWARVAVLLPNKCLILRNGWLITARILEAEAWDPNPDHPDWYRYRRRQTRSAVPGCADNSPPRSHVSAFFRANEIIGEGSWKIHTRTRTLPRICRAIR